MQQMATVNMVCAGSIVVIETHRTQPTRAGPCGVILSSIIVCVIRRILQVHLAARTAWRPGRLSMVWEFCKSCWTLGSPCNLGLAHRCAGRKKTDSSIAYDFCSPANTGGVLAAFAGSHSGIAESPHDFFRKSSLSIPHLDSPMLCFVASTPAETLLHEPLCAPSSKRTPGSPVTPYRW